MRDRERFSPGQSRGARGLLGWEREDLARLAGLEVEAVELYEAGEGGLAEPELAALGNAFSKTGGVIAIPAHHGGEGVRLRTPRTPFAPPGDPFDDLPLSARAHLVEDLADALAEAVHFPEPGQLRSAHAR
jgi:hypothetical protein